MTELTGGHPVTAARARVIILITHIITIPGITIIMLLTTGIMITLITMASTAPSFSQDGIEVILALATTTVIGLLVCTGVPGDIRIVIPIGGGIIPTTAVLGMVLPGPDITIALTGMVPMDTMVITGEEIPTGAFLAEPDPTVPGA
jgi:hypothetical protein